MMRTEKEYLEERIATLQRMRLRADYTFAKVEQEYKTKVQMTLDSIDECNIRLEELKENECNIRLEELKENV
jgi:hypothetical protein